MFDKLSDTLHQETKKKIEIKINQNKSYFFVLKYYRNTISLSLHHFFLKAPDDVLEALVKYVVNKNKTDFSLVKQFIYSNQIKLNFSDQFDKSKLITTGNYFNLEDELNKVNQKYFNSRYDFLITWFKPSYKTFRHITFGSYDRIYKLIKINKLLDHKNVNREYMQYLIFHEILHEVFPSKILKSGRCQMHGKAFKDYEKTFPNFNQMKEFETYFMQNIWRKNGRT
jgi:hypothetical protein